jgi:methylase of polypeptide subunit release factors
MLELACGAGHIGQAAAMLSGRPLVQVDRNPSACAWAERNAAAAGIADTVDVRVGDFTGVVAAGERFPLVIADPPYVPTAEVSRFPADPTVAIDGGADGLDLIRTCLDVAAAHLVPAGAVVLQVRGEEQAAVLPRLCPALTIVAIRTYGDDRALVHLGR